MQRGFIYIVAWAATPDTRGPSPHLFICTHGYQAGRILLLFATTSLPFAGAFPFPLKR